MASKDELEIEYEAAVLDIKKEDLANDLFNSDITIWLTYALGELSKYEAWLKENSMDNTKNMNYVSKLQNRIVEDSYAAVDTQNKSQFRMIEEGLSLGNSLLPEDQVHAELSYSKAIEEDKKLDDDIQEALKKLLQERAKAAQLDELHTAFDEATIDVDRVLANVTSATSLKK